MKSIYVTDKKYRWAALFILVVGGLFIWSSPWIWPYVVGFWVLIAAAAYLLRNNE